MIKKFNTFINESSAEEWINDFCNKTGLSMEEALKKLNDFKEELSRVKEDPKVKKVSDRDLSNDVYAVMTEKSKLRKKITSMSHDAYHFKYKNLDELEKLKKKYYVGGFYDGSKIIDVCTLHSKNIV